MSEASSDTAHGPNPIYLRTDTHDGRKLLDIKLNTARKLRMMRPNCGPILDPSLLTYALAAASDSVEIDDIGGYVLFVNDAWRQLFDRDGQGVTGVRWDSFQLGDADNAGLRSTWAQCVASGRAGGAFGLSQADGTRLTVLYTRLLYRNVYGTATAVVTTYCPRRPATSADHRPALSVALLETIPDKEAAMNSLAGMSRPQWGQLKHSLRNLLTVIAGNVELLDKSIDDRILQGRLSLIRRAARSCMELLDQT